MLACGAEREDTVRAQSTVPTPSVPTFTVQIVDHTHYVEPVAPTYTTNPYTGEQQLVSPGQSGYTADNWTIDVSIKNQPFTYGNSSYHLYYDVRMKGHFSDSWEDLYPLANLLSGDSSWATSEYIQNGIKESSSDYTLISIPAGEYPAGGQIDLQVQALIGHDSTYFEDYGYAWPQPQRTRLWSF